MPFRIKKINCIGRGISLIIHDHNSPIALEISFLLQKFDL